MNARLSLSLAAVCLVAGCAKTFRPADGAAPPLAVHPVVTTPEPGARQCISNETAGGGPTYYFFPDRELTGVRVESASRESTGGSNYVVVQWAAGDRDRLRAFAEAHPKADRFGFRFESTPVGLESNGRITRGRVIFQVVIRSELTGDFRLRFARPTPEAADLLALQIVGR